MPVRCDASLGASSTAKRDVCSNGSATPYIRARVNNNSNASIPELYIGAHPYGVWDVRVMKHIGEAFTSIGTSLIAFREILLRLLPYAVCVWYRGIQGFAEYSQPRINHRPAPSS